jgi:cation transport protein ChaC
MRDCRRYVLKRTMAVQAKRSRSGESGAGRTLALTPELVALTIREVADPGPPPGRAPYSDADYAAEAAAVMAAAPSDEVWLFAYGSLIWSPACESVELRIATLRGWHRAFRLGWDFRFRGSKETPGLMMALDRGGQCAGILLRLPPGREAENLIALFRRELRYKPSGNALRWVTVECDGGPKRAITFVVDRKGPAYAGKRPHEKTAAVLARACGHWGSGAEYLRNTVAKLAEHGIYDRNLWRLQALVAERIRHAHRRAGGNVRDGIDAGPPQP